VSSGHVFILDTPLFRVRNKSETVYCYSEAERDAALERLKSPEVTRFKGLGEIGPKEFKQFIDDDDLLRRVTVGSMSDVKDALDFFMGKNTPARKEYIIEHLIADIA
jgi:DNA gyrase/topoisomerase IV subunit B